MSIGKLVPGQASYYEQSVAHGRDDYYSGHGEAPGQWTGAAATRLGLVGRVDAARFNAMIAGIDPSDTTLRRTLLSKERKVRTINGKRHAPVAAYDLTFSAPKSISVLFALADPPVARELVAAHDVAVHGALEYLEQEALYTRRGRNGAVVERGEGLLAAAYRHRMSRAKDPQLHTHVVAANLVRTPSDGQWRALHAAVIYRHARTAGTLYQAHLRAEVTDRLGLTWGPVVKGAAELDGVPREVLREFSRRRVEIEQAARDDNIPLTTKAQGEALALKTRTAKDHTVRTRDWRIDIHARAQEHGLDDQALRELLATGHHRLRDLGPTGLDHPSSGDPHRPAETTPPDGPPHRSLAPDPDELLRHLVGPDGLTANANTFDTRDALRAIAEQHQQGIPVTATRALAETLTTDHPEVLATRPEDFTGIVEPRHTTTDLVRTEQALIAAAVGRADSDVARVPPEQVERFLTGREQPLNPEQQRVVRGVATSGNGVDVIEALAGTGKTFTASAIHDLYTQTGRPVLGVAPTGRAARELTEAGISARTIHALLATIDHHTDHPALPAGAVLVLDEASMSPTRLTRRLLQLAHDAQAKVVAIGDSGQLPSVQAGGWLRQIGERSGGPHHLTTVMRQRDPHERDVLRRLHDDPRGGTAYLTWLDRHDRLHIDHLPARLLDTAIDAWTSAIDEHGIEQAVLIARDQATRHALNDRARTWLHHHDRLGQDSRYGERAFATGDRVIARRNDTALDLDNGTRATITTTSPDRIELRTNAGATRIVPAGYVVEHLEHAYALTGHAMQGATVQWAAVIARQEQLTKGWAYTALSRAREQTRLYVPTENPTTHQDRVEIAPRDDRDAVDRDQLLQRIADRMATRDDEDLATTQLQRSEPSVPRAGLEATNAAPTPRPDTTARSIDERRGIVRLVTEQRARAQQRLDDLPPPIVRRFRGPRDGHAVERAALTAALRAADEQLQRIEKIEPRHGCEPDRVDVHGTRLPGVVIPPIDDRPHPDGTPNERTAPSRHVEPSNVADDL
ncbi:MAG: MobF family relaxase [Solirubrobacteraceae bacterium]